MKIHSYISVLSSPSLIFAGTFVNLDGNNQVHLKTNRKEQLVHTCETIFRRNFPNVQNSFPHTII